MSTAIQALTVFLPVFYIITTVLFGMSFAGAKGPHLGGWRTSALVTVIVLHIALFWMRGQVVGGFPITGTWQVLSAAALTTTVLFGLISWRSHQASVGAIVLCVVSFLELLASAFVSMAPEPFERVAAIEAVLFHVCTSVLASAALILSGIYGFVHLLLYRQMVRKSFGPLFRQLPDLELLSAMTRRAALAGFLFLTVGLNLGIGMAHANKIESFSYTDPHVLLTIALWIHFGVIAFSRKIRGFSGRRASWAAAAGLITLIVTLLLTLLPQATFHALG